MSVTCQNCKIIQKCNKTHNSKCSEFELCGSKPMRPKKSRDLCSGCNNNWYNVNKDGKCWSYLSAKVILVSRPNGLRDRPPWRLDYKLSCFVRVW